MKRFKLIFLLTIIETLAFTLISCDETTNTVVPDKVPDPPSKLRATSIAKDVIRIKWDASPSVSDSAFDGYSLTIDNGTPIIIPSTDITYTATGLTGGTEYTFALVAKFKNGKQSVAATVKWSPASRFTQTSNGFAIKVYETASTDFGSGLDLFDESEQAPKNLKVDATTSWDLGLDTRSGAKLFGSPRAINYNYNVTPNVTEISDDYYDDVATFDEIYDTQALSATNFSSQLLDLSQFTPTKGALVIITRTYVNSATKPNYAKVLIKYLNNSFFQTDGKNLYIECQVSYQITPDIPYAL
jgi:hypothetical protein